MNATVRESELSEEKQEKIDEKKKRKSGFKINIIKYFTRARDTQEKICRKNAFASPSVCAP